MTRPLLEVRDLVATHRPPGFGSRRKTVRAVDGVSFDLHAGETLGIVGESGCGKSTLARTLLRLHEPTSGSALYEGSDIFAMDAGQLKRARRDLQMVFQDPFASLDPTHTIGEIIAEGWRAHRGIVPRVRWRARAQELMELVGLVPEHIERKVGQFSGGQRQRIGIARALAVEPKVLIADEPVSALDVSVQAQILNLFLRLQDELGLSCIFVTHDLAVVRRVSHRIAVMYLGKLVEIGSGDQISDASRHPYTRALLSSSLDADASRPVRERIVLTGDLPSPANPPTGCRFRTRCWRATEICATVEPPLDPASSEHLFACHHPMEPGEVR